MTIEEKKKILEYLQKEKAKIESRIIDLKEITKPISPSDAIGRISRMDAINNRSVNEAALRAAEIKLRNIEISLAKIDEPDFGKCRQCGDTIPLGRLLVMPGSTRCIGCASRSL